MVIYLNKKDYKELVSYLLPKDNIIKKLFYSFICGGFIGILSELLIRLYMLNDSISKSSASSLMIVTFIFLASLFTALGFFDNLVEKFGAGLIIPITGFAHSLASSALDHKNEGLVYGIGTNIFKLSGNVILFGTISAYVFGLIRYLFFGDI